MGKAINYYSVLLLVETRFKVKQLIFCVCLEVFIGV